MFGAVLSSGQKCGGGGFSSGNLGERFQNPPAPGTDRPAWTFGKTAGRIPRETPTSAGNGSRHHGCPFLPPSGSGRQRTRNRNENSRQHIQATAILHGDGRLMAGWLNPRAT